MAFATVGELVNFARVQLFDLTVADDDTRSLFSNAELIAYANRAQQEFAEFTKCLLDNSTYTISVASGTREYTLDDDILELYSGWLGTTGKRVFPRTFEDIELGYALNTDTITELGAWETVTGPVEFIIVDHTFGKITTYPISDVTETLNLNVAKTATAITAMNDTLEIDPNFHIDLVDSVRSQAYSKQDSETVDPERAALLNNTWKSKLQEAKRYYDTKYGRNT